MERTFVTNGKIRYPRTICLFTPVNLTQRKYKIIVQVGEEEKDAEEAQQKSMQLEQVIMPKLQNEDEYKHKKVSDSKREIRKTCMFLYMLDIQTHKSVDCRCTRMNI